MDCQSSHTFDSDESDIDIQTEIYEKGGSIDDIRNDLDFCLRDDDKVAEQSVVDLPMDGVEPYIGMEFSSRDEAREFYVNYGRRVGFTVRIHHNRRSRVNNQVIGQDFVCSKEGFRAKKYVCRKDRILPAPPITREGCQAMMRLALRDGGKWAVTKFVKDHNHLLLSPSKVPWRGSGKNLLSEVCFRLVCFTQLKLSICICISIGNFLACYNSGCIGSVFFPIMKLALSICIRKLFNHQTLESNFWFDNHRVERKRNAYLLVLTHFFQHA